LEDFSLDKIWLFKPLIILAAMIVISCGAKPHLKLVTDGSPEAVWNAYQKRFTNINSLALGGKLESRGKNNWECDFQITYAYPDSFAFLAEGAFGVDLVRGAIVGDSGFWEIPREKKIKLINGRDDIESDGSESVVVPVQLLHSIFFFKSGSNFVYIKSEEEFTYRDTNESALISVVLAGETCLPQKMIFGKRAECSSAIYSKWKEFEGNCIFPTKIEYSDSKKDDRLTFRITRVKHDAKIPKAMYLPKTQ
jgi:hypothetical protein